MRLKCIGSSSRGNCYIIHDEHEALVIEAGVSFRKFQKALNYDLKKVAAVIVSHEHGDHSKYIKKFIDSGIPVLAPRETFQKYKITSNLATEVLHQHEYSVGGFTIKPFDVNHDVKTLGFLIYHKKIGKTLFVTDTPEIEYSFRGLNNILIESNHSLEIMEKNVADGIITPYLSNRIRESHMNIDTTINFLSKLDKTFLNNIVLIHLSKDNADANLFKQKVSDEFSNTVHVAKDGLDVKFSKTPF